MSGLDVKSGDEKISTEPKKEEQLPLLHSSLNDVPIKIRFGVAGILSNFLFLTGYQKSIDIFEPMGYSVSMIYSIFYMLYIPVGHLQTCLLVFGWPSEYLSSLLSNIPIGVTSMILGATATGWLDANHFDERIFLLLQDYAMFLVGKQELVLEEVQGKYSSIVVMLLTGGWTYILTSMVMSPKKDKED